MAEFYVCPSGDDRASGTLERPFVTLRRAQEAAREAAGEVTVNLRAGTYPLDGPLTFTSADSGSERHPVMYQAYRHDGERERVVVSGGREITDWRERDGVWLAEVGDLDTRQLYVDGRRVERAGIDTLPGHARRTDTGYLTDSADPLDWRAPGGIEFVYRGIYPWTEARCGVDAVTRDGDSTVIAMAQPTFARAISLYNSSWEGQVMSGPDLPTRVENDPSFLTEPGSFVVDRSRPGRHVLHYRPREGERPQRTRVIAPFLETLVHATGTRNVVFAGVTFADATWLQPHRAQGFLHYHGSGYYDGGGVDTVTVIEGQSWVTVPTRSQTIPACVRLDDTAGFRFEDCRFTRLGAAGLGATDGTGLVVRGCDFDTIAGSGVTVTGSRDSLVEDNLIRHIGLDYPGSPGIGIMDTVDCVVANNQVSEVPHCGIVAGPGRGTRILRNLTTATMGVLADGGGIYLSGPQGTSHRDGAVVTGNVIKDTRTPYNFALYTDYGASWVRLEENVVARADNSAVLQVSPPLEHVVYQGNFWDADPIGSDVVPAGVTYDGNTTIVDEAELDEATSGIQERAGLLREISG